MLSSPKKLTPLIEFWLGLPLGQRIKLFFVLLGLASPFFPWFHSCNNIPGSYQCVTWHGFQWDNDIYGLFVFLLSVSALILLVYPLLNTDWKPSISRTSLSISAGAAMALLALLRVFTFQGTSSQTTTIGPSMGLLFVFVAGAGIVICDNTQIVQKFLSFILTSRSQNAPPAESEDTGELPDYNDDELSDLLGETQPPVHTEPEQQRF